MTYQANYLPDTGPFTQVISCQAVDHGAQGQYRIVRYGASLRGGRLTLADNGVAVLLEPRGPHSGAVVVDGLGQAVTPSVGSGAHQHAIFHELATTDWPRFRTLINRSDNTRFKL